jgi:hypothetical protein
MRINGFMPVWKAYTKLATKNRFFTPLLEIVHMELNHLIAK